MCGSVCEVCVSNSKAWVCFCVVVVSHVLWISPTHTEVVTRGGEEDVVLLCVPGVPAPSSRCECCPAPVCPRPSPRIYHATPYHSARRLLYTPASTAECPTHLTPTRGSALTDTSTWCPQSGQGCPTPRLTQKTVSHHAFSLSLSLSTLSLYRYPC